MKAVKAAKQNYEPLEKFANPVVVGQLGEHYARRWLERQGYQVEGFLYLQLAFSERYPEWVEPPLPEEERRRRWIDSLNTRIDTLERNIEETEESPDAAHYQLWLSRQKQDLKQMQEALNDLKLGKPLNKIHEPRQRDLFYASGTGQWVKGLYQLKRKQAVAFLGSRLRDFLRYSKECDRLSSEAYYQNAPKNVPRTRPASSKAIRSDMVAKRNGDYYLVEVKANQSDLTSLQRRALKAARKFGFTPKIVRVKILADCSEETLE